MIKHNHKRTKISGRHTRFFKRLNKIWNLPFYVFITFTLFNHGDVSAGGKPKLKPNEKMDLNKPFVWKNILSFSKQNTF